MKKKRENNGLFAKGWEKFVFAIDIIKKFFFQPQIEDSKWNTIIQFIKFGIVGLSNTCISYVIYVITLIFLQKNRLIESWDYLFAQIIAFVLSVLWSFYWNNKYVFRSDNKSKYHLITSLVKTYISYAFSGLFLSSVLSLVWVEVFHISKLITPVINLIVSVPINFMLNKFWAFNKGND